MTRLPKLFRPPLSALRLPKLPRLPSPSLLLLPSFRVPGRSFYPLRPVLPASKLA